MQQGRQDRTRKFVQHFRTGLQHLDRCKQRKGSFGTDWRAPSVFWFVGGTDPDLYAKAKAANRLNELPVNHSPKFAPVLHPTLRMGVETLAVAATTWMPA